MKQFIKRVCLFLLIPLVLSLGFNLIVNPYYGNAQYNTKLNYFNQNKSDYNSVVFGSSRLYRHFNTKLFDSLTNDNIKSFNLAAPGTYNPEAYFLYDEFLKKVNHNTIKYAFIELQSLIDMVLRQIL